MVFGRICLADGSIAFMRTGRLSVVPALAPAVRAVGLDGADHHLDSEHHPNLLRLAFAHAWSSMAGSWLDYAAGIRSRGNCLCNYRVSPVQTAVGNPMLNGLDLFSCIRNLVPDIQRKSVQFTKEQIP